MVTLQDISLQLTKPVKELSEWHFPFSQTLEKYCSLFNTTNNKNFGEAGLVVQNSTAVYVHRIDSLWNKTEYFQKIFLNHEHNELEKTPIKKKDRQTNMCLQEFKTVNFAEEVEQNIDIKKNHLTHNTVKSKNRCFTQLEKGIAQHISIDIYDVNGEVIGKKYNFRCNQNIGLNGVLIDEFAPQDFHCRNDISVEEESSSSSINLHVTEPFDSSCSTLTMDSAGQDNNENINSDIESTRNGNDSLKEKISDLVTSFTSNQHSLSLSRNTDANNMLSETLTNISNDMCLNISSNTSSLITNIEGTTLSNNNDLNTKYLNNDIRKSIDIGSVLDSPPESVNSKGRRTSLMDDPTLLNNTSEDLLKTKLVDNSKQNISKDRNTRNKLRSDFQITRKSLKRKLFTSCKKKRNPKKKNLTHSLKKSNSSRREQICSYGENLNTCVKYIRECDPLQYDDVTNVTLDLLGFSLHASIESDTDINDDIITTSIDDEISELHSPSLIDMLPSNESFCNAWLRADSPRFLPDNVDKWHELMQPKLHETEQRPMFCIRDYTSRIMEILKTSDQKKLKFDTIVREERSHEVARYFLASLDLASRQNVNINMDEDLEHNIEIVLHEKDEQCSINT